MADPVTTTFLRDREKLISIACSIVHDQAIAEDLVPDSWLRWERSSYPARDARTIFRVTVANLARDWRRRQRIEFEILKYHTEASKELRDAERVVVARQELRKIVAALEELPPRMVTAFRMRRIDGCTYPEIARHLDTVPSRVYDYVTKVVAHLTLALLD